MLKSMDPESIQWNASEFVYHEKSPDWYWILGILTVFGALISVVLRNVLFAILIIVAALIVALYASKRPSVGYFEINRRGVLVNKKLHPYSALESFWVDEVVGQTPKLLLTPKNTFSLQIVLPLHGDVDITNMRTLLSKNLEEVEQSESIVERVMELVHF
jgi:hypothetical protein